MTIAEIRNEMITDFANLTERMKWLPIGKYAIATMIATPQQVSDITFHDHPEIEFQICVDTLHRDPSKPYVEGQINRKVCVTQGLHTPHEHTETFNTIASAFVHFASLFVTQAMNDYFEEKTVASLTKDDPDAFDGAMTDESHVPHSERKHVTTEELQTAIDRVSNRD